MPAIKIHQSVAELIATQLEACGKTQTQVAEEVGFDRPNVITMIKQGKTKLPLNKIGPMARALGIDAMRLFHVTMAEYFPETWDQIEKMAEQPVLSENEVQVILALREGNTLPMRRIMDSERGPLVRAIQAAVPKF